MASSIITIKNFSFRYEGQDYYSVRNISMNINRSDIVLLAGRSGAGKTTLARAMTGLIPHFYHGEYTGDVIVAGMKVRDTPLNRLSEVIGLVRQNPENQILMSTVERDVAFSLEFSGIGRDEMHRLVDEILDKLGISHLRSRHVDSLSGGELQKVALAAILVKKPEIIILDEPSAYLSPKSVMILKDMVINLNSEGYTIIIIDHKLEYWMDIVRKVIVIDGGRIVFDGEPTKFIKAIVGDTYGLNIPLYVRLILDIRRICGKDSVYPAIDLDLCVKQIEEMMGDDRV